MNNILTMARRFVSAVATPGRLSAMGAVGVIGIIIGFAINRAADAPSELERTEFLARFGLTLFVPLVALVVTSATLGTLLEERTLHYFWLRPIGRWKIAAAALLAGLVVLLPIVLIPMGILGAIVGDGDDVTGILISSLCGIIGYASVFTLLGVLTQRALAWGLVYILVWEGFVAGLSRTAGWFALRTYSTSTLSRVADAPGLLDDPVKTTTIIIITALVAAGCFALTTLRLERMDVS